MPECLLVYSQPIPFAVCKSLQLLNLTTCPGGTWTLPGRQ